MVCAESSVDLGISGGYPVDRADVRAVLLSIVNPPGGKPRIDPLTGKPYVISYSYIKKFMIKYNISLQKSSQLDPKRAMNATADIRDAWFDLLDAYVKRLHSERKIPWDSWEMVPDRCKYNMDEVRGNLRPNSHRGVVPHPPPDALLVSPRI